MVVNVHYSHLINCDAEIGGRLVLGEAFRMPAFRLSPLDSGGVSISPGRPFSQFPTCYKVSISVNFSALATLKRGGCLWGEATPRPRNGKPFFRFKLIDYAGRRHCGTSNNVIEAVHKPASARVAAIYKAGSAP